MDTAANLNTETKGRLLLVDDEENILRSLRRVLRRGDWEIETALDAESALVLCERFQPAVVVSDFRMPGMNGVDFLERVKHLMPHAQRIMLTGQADQQAIEEAINRSQVFRFIGKPWNDAQVLLTVKSAFEQHYLVSDNQRLAELTKAQNVNLRQLNADLEQRVLQRTQMLEVAKREWELSFDTIDNPLAIVNTNDLTLRRANRAFAKMAGCEVLELNKGLKCHEVLFQRGAQCTGCSVHAAKSSQFEIAHGSRTFVANVYPMGDEPIAVCHYRDVTEERVLARNLLETEKMIAIGNLAGGVAHEINNPLGGILSFSQLMKRDEGRSAKDLEALDLIEESALRCKRIVESLLKFSRRSRVEDRRSFDLNRCVEDTARLFIAQLKNHPRATLEVKPHGAPLEVYGDPAQLGQVVLNLLQNGLQALPQFEGALKVETGLIQGTAECFLRVTDTGCGIPEENLSRIFEPHFTTKPPGEGTGLGLSIAYRIVEDHGGRFSVTSNPGRGSSFEVQVPVRIDGERT